MEMGRLVTSGLRRLEWPESFLTFPISLAGVQELRKAEAQVPESGLKDSHLAQIALGFYNFVYMQCVLITVTLITLCHPSSSPSEQNKSPNGYTCMKLVPNPLYPSHNH